jgi:hypothetical protein
MAPTDSCAFGSTVSCDGPEDCGNGQLCNVKPGSFPLAVGCVDQTDPYSSFCHTDADCTGSQFDVRCCHVGVMFTGMSRCLMSSICPAP